MLGHTEVVAWSRFLNITGENVKSLGYVPLLDIFVWYCINVSYILAFPYLPSVLISTERTDMQQKNNEIAK